MFCRRDLILLKLRTWFEEYFPLHFLEYNSIKEPHRESTSVNTEFTYSSRPKMCIDWDFFAAFSVQNTTVSKTTRHVLWWILNLKLVSFWNQGCIKIPKTRYSSQTSFLKPWYSSPIFLPLPLFNNNIGQMVLLPFSLIYVIFFPTAIIFPSHLHNLIFFPNRLDKNAKKKNYKTDWMLKLKIKFKNRLFFVASFVSIHLFC